jgi:hypothetical protein
MTYPLVYNILNKLKMPDPAYINLERFLITISLVIIWFFKIIIWVTRLELAQHFYHPGLNGTCLPIPAHPFILFMPKIRLELTTKAASMLCSTN